MQTKAGRKLMILLKKASHNFLSAFGSMYKKLSKKIPLLLSYRNTKKAAVLFFIFLSFAFYNAACAVKLLPWRVTLLSESQKNANKNLLSEVEWHSLVSELERKTRQWPAETGIVLKDLQTGRVWNKNPDEKFRSASLIKVPIAAAVMEKISEGEVAINSPLKISRNNKVSGSGTLRWEPNGASVPLDTALFKMITESDNTAAKMIIDKIGLDSISSSIENIGLSHTNICKNISNLTSSKVKEDSFTTPSDMANLFEKIYDGHLVDNKHSAYLLGILKQTKSHNRLRVGLPRGWELGHKTGMLRRACHDVGIVFSPRGNYLLVVMTGNVPNYDQAKAFITSVGKITYKYYMPHALDGNRDIL